MKKIFTPKKGFTLVETLVAISVLLVALAGPLTIAVKGLTTATYSRDQITSFYLAQEGIEYIRNLRDNLGISNAYIDDINLKQLWTTNFSQCLSPNYCKLDSRKASGNLVKCIPSADLSSVDTCELNFDKGNTDLYGFDGQQSIFKRYITIVPIGTVDINGKAFEYRVTTTVSWTSTLPNKPIVLTELITNWTE